MNNSELCTRVRELMWYALKRYNELEDNHRIMEPSKLSSKSQRYLLDVKRMLESYANAINDIYIRVSIGLVDTKDDEND